MLGHVLKDVESKHSRINKWLFIYKQWELLMVTGRKLKSEMINSGCGTVSGHVFCYSAQLQEKTDHLDQKPIIMKKIHLL